MRTERQEREVARQRADAERRAAKARCMACGKKVTPQDECTDGQYLHIECAHRTSQQ